MDKKKLMRAGMLAIALGAVYAAKPTAANAESYVFTSGSCSYYTDVIHSSGSDYMVCTGACCRGYCGDEECYQY